MMAAAPTARRTVQPSRRAHVARRVWDALRDLLGRGYGILRFVPDENGDLRHESTVYTVKPRLYENAYDFVERIKREYAVNGAQCSIDVVVGAPDKVDHAKVTIKP